MRELTDQVVVVIGAGGGMGQAICRQLVREKGKLAIASNDSDSLKKLEQDIAGQGADILSETVDVTKEEEVRDFFAKISDTFGKPDILLNLPGVSIPAKIPEMTLEQYNLSMDVNVMGPFLCSKHFIPYVDPEKGGLIINIGSMAAKRANANAPLYCTAKAALNMLSDGMALQVKDHNIRVTTLNPGPTDTKFWGDRKIPREKFMKAEDIADVVLFVMKSKEYIVFHDIAFESFSFFRK